MRPFSEPEDCACSVSEAARQIAEETERNPETVRRRIYEGGELCKDAQLSELAGTATVARVLSEKINENAAPGDRVSGGQLRDRVRYHEGDVKWENSPNNDNSQFRTSFTGDNEWYTPIEYVEAAQLAVSARRPDRSQRKRRETQKRSGNE